MTFSVERRNDRVFVIEALGITEATPGQGLSADNYIVFKNGKKIKEFSRLEKAKTFMEKQGIINGN